MKSGRRYNSSNDDGYDATDWDDFGADISFNTRNDRYSNAYGDYRGGYGPMNSASSGGFGATNLLGFQPLNVNYPQSSNMGPSHLSEQEVNYEMGQGYGPQGPVRQRRNNDKTIRFLLRCGIPHDKIRNLPKSMLELMNEESCGLCGQSFNAFAIARIHYVSKNHYKNQKKLLSQYSEGGVQGYAEIPFKARELYCEICDVHITSKSHADSHYAGKPHRAIVEGRKMPRNPILLQENMASRLEQLIRREKKSLKSAEDQDGTNEEAAKDCKLIQPELYCQICKTSVTCTEQMTMHLNGKRHLSKEKKHILSMMKGESNEGQEKGNESVVEDDKGDDENLNTGDDGEGNRVSNDEQAGDGEGEDVWGNGSGNWDEPETIW